MRILFGILLLFLSAFSAMSQPNFNISLEEVTLPNATGLQSFVVGQHNGKWLLLGGRTDGLHRRQPWAAFLAEGNNVMAYVIDPEQLQVWSSPISGLPTTVYEQLQSTNMEFAQRDTVLYIAGGYGYSATAGDHITYPNLVAVNIPAAIQSVMNGSGINNHVHHVVDEAMAVTGGYMGILNDRFYLVCGQYFEGRYNPMGPNMGPGFIQEYTEAIRSFIVNYNGTDLSISNYTEISDPQELHRRDYNMVPQIFVNGDTGFTVFSGVFQHTEDLPWHNTVDVTESGYSVNNSFDQMLSQYHSAHIPIFDEALNEMYTVFFGGMSRYRYDSSTGTLIDDEAVPFVKTISMVTRASDGSMSETNLEIEMPAFLGSGAEFIENENLPYTDEGILNLNAMPQSEPVLVGYIYGGIESSAENIFFINTGTQSWSSDRLFKVFVTAGASTGLEGTEITGQHVFTLETHPNPVSDILNVQLGSSYKTKGVLTLKNLEGKEVLRRPDIVVDPGQIDLEINVGHLPKGNYVIKFTSNAFETVSRVVIGS